MTKLSESVSAVARAAQASMARLLRGASTRKAPRGLTVRAHKLHGVEIFPGVGTPLSRTTRYGATFVATEKGGTSTTMIGWVNYTPIFFKPFTRCTIVGGRWWVVSRKGLRYQGLLYGSFGRGEVLWNKDAKLATVSVPLETSGGGTYRSVPYKTGHLTAALNHLPFPPSPPVIAGTLELTR